MTPSTEHGVRQKSEPVEIISTEFIEHSGEYVLIVNTDEKVSLSRDLPAIIGSLNLKEVLNCDRLILAGGNSRVKVDRQMFSDLLPRSENEGVFVDRARGLIKRDYGLDVTIKDGYSVLTIRIPINDVAEFADKDSDNLKSIVRGQLPHHIMNEVVSVYLISDSNYVRLNPYSFFEEMLSAEGGGCEESIELPDMGKVRPRLVEGKDGIIFGVSEEEMRGLARKYLTRKLKLEVLENVLVVDQFGVEYNVDFVGLGDNYRVLACCYSDVGIEHIGLVRMLMKDLNMNEAIIVANRPAPEEVLEALTDSIKIKTADEL